MSNAYKVTKCFLFPGNFSLQKDLIRKIGDIEAKFFENPVFLGCMLGFAFCNEV